MGSPWLALATRRGGPAVPGGVMIMNLSRRDEMMLEGREGPAVRAAMEILVRVGDAYGADELVDAHGVHIGGVSFGTSGEGGLDFALKFASLGARVRVPTTLNISGRDATNWRRFGLPQVFAGKCASMEQAYLSMGCIPTWTCAPYQVGMHPRFGELVAWSESNAIVYANSVLGARTPRYGDFVPLCVAITGRAPRFGLYLDDAREPSVHLAFRGLENHDGGKDVLASAIGHLTGEIAGARVPVLTGIPRSFRADELKALGASAASGGAVGMFHAAGITPEAPTLETVLRGAKPEKYEFSLEDLMGTARRLSSTDGGPVELVALGCPHFSFDEMRRLASALGGRRVSPSTRVWVFTNRVTASWADETGIGGALRESGVEISTDSCLLSWPSEAWDFGSLMTNSGKFAFYSRSRCDAVLLGSLEECAEVAVSGFARR
ncbi:MAG: DUF521 domain-containing protein [Firmicutes bacterium]|nr:DUF521 domain-containing protein [Bacillota bacterium]